MRNPEASCARLQPGRERVTVKVELSNQGTVAWMPTEESLVGAKRAEPLSLNMWGNLPFTFGSIPYGQRSRPRPEK